MRLSPFGCANLPCLRRAPPRTPTLLPRLQPGSFHSACMGASCIARTLHAFKLPHALLSCDQLQVPLAMFVPTFNDFRDV